MLIDLDLIVGLLEGINIARVLHIGAHECEELPFYKNMLNLSDDNIIWIEAMDNKVDELKNRNISNVYNAVVTDKDDDAVIFNVANNGESSSILEFGTHSTEHPTITVTRRIIKKTITVDSFFERNNLDASQCHFWNFDIQGAELIALKGASKSIVHAKAIYLEVNEQELYKGCGLIGDVDSFLSAHGFIRVVTNITVHGWGDALYINTNYINDNIRKYIDSENSYQLALNKNAEKLFYNYFKNEIDIIFDIGSNEDSIYSTFSGEVHYFESSINLLDNLKKTTNNNKSVFNNFILSNFVKTGKEYMDAHKLANVELLKIADCDNTLEILKGFDTKLKDIKYLQFSWTDKDNMFFIEIINYLKLSGFNNFSYLKKDGPIPINNYYNILKTSTIVCINNSYTKKVFMNSSANSSYKTLNPNLAFYTCFFGEDTSVANIIPEVPTNKYDCYYFTNNITTYNKLLNTKWKRILLTIPIKETYNLNSMDSKELKACPNHYPILNDYDYTCYFDSKLTIDAIGVEKLIETELSNTQKLMILPKHNYLTLNNWKPNVWYEFNECLHQQRYYIEKNRYFNYIQKQLDKGLVDTNKTHYSTHFIIRKNSMLTNKINDLWLEHINECGIECQISFFFINQLYSDYIKPIESYQCYSQN